MSHMSGSLESRLCKRSWAALKIWNDPHSGSKKKYLRLWIAQQGGKVAMSAAADFSCPKRWELTHSSIYHYLLRLLFFFFFFFFILLFRFQQKKIHLQKGEPSFPFYHNITIFFTTTLTHALSLSLSVFSTP
jgi:ascorbate-specific PTS system EIIC-type component UlaA